MLVCLAVAGCSNLPLAERLTRDEKASLLDGESVQTSAPAHAAMPVDSVLATTEEMRRFASDATAGHGSEKGKLHSLVEAVISPAGLGLRYDPNATFTAEEAFHERRANCLSFTLMVVALARQVGLSVKFNEVDIPPVWDLAMQDTLVLYKHVNALFEDRNGTRQVVDVNMDEYDSSFQQRAIPDVLAQAQYFNNRAMEFLEDRDFAAALRDLRVALSLDSHVSYFWSNLGSLFRRAGNQHAAELAYRAALEEDPSDFVAVSNAARLYEELGRKNLAAELRQRADYYRMRNPYYRYKLAQDAFMHARYEDARRHLAEAIRLYPMEHRFHFLLGAVYQQMGDRDRAVASMNRALALATDPNQATKYRSKMSRLLSAGL